MEVGASLWSEIGFGGQLSSSRSCSRRGKSDLPEAEMTIPYSPLEQPLSWSHQQLTFPSQVTKTLSLTDRGFKRVAGKLNFIGSIATAASVYQSKFRSLQRTQRALAPKSQELNLLRYFQKLNVNIPTLLRATPPTVRLVLQQKPSSSQ